jgi:hypothetical protein
VVDRLDLDALTSQYAGSGSAAHHPAVLLGLLLYGYASRKIERATPHALPQGLQRPQTAHATCVGRTSPENHCRRL